ETRTVDQVQKTPFALPKGYEWYNLDVDNDEDMGKLYALLEGNYVEDDDAMFRFAYTKEFLKWALAPPGYRKDWHCVVRVESSKTFVAFIAAIPMLIGLRHQQAESEEKFDKNVKMVEINFLCVHKKLRDKRLAPLLIGEITRRVNLTNVWQAIYTAGVVIPRPISKARYYHRSLNPEKLIDIKFSSIPSFARSFSNPMEVTKKYYRLNPKEKIPNIRPLKSKDCAQVAALLNDYLSSFKVAPIFTKEEVAHWFIGRDGVIYSFVITGDSDDKIIDFISFYSLPSTIIGNPKHQVLRAAYLFFYTCKNTKVEELMKTALIEAQTRDFDVFNCVNILDNKEFLDKLKFGTGDGYLYYYLFNYKFPDLEPEQVGLTML
ncbi:glycylpeptide N-tetradecanoyltransferase 2, partial [Naegleria gruberi]